MQLTHWQILPPLNSSVMSVSTRGTVVVIWGHTQGDEKLELPVGLFPSETEQGEPVTVRLTVSKQPFEPISCCPSPLFFAILCFSFGDIPVSMAPSTVRRHCQVFLRAETSWRTCPLDEHHWGLTSTLMSQ